MSDKAERELDGDAELVEQMQSEAEQGAATARAKLRGLVEQVFFEGGGAFVRQDGDKLVIVAVRNGCCKAVNVVVQPDDELAGKALRSALEDAKA